ncbi:Cutinase transcription factor 1 (Acyl-CoA dehydrogenase domain-containing protein) [Pleurostoma richardsiae]|uniref:Cutinase transcription factor 1 (Acyl-CoA dehydrogenase domain-containing protein) n=1 Tax=Pleurostoma richardsiae TaxID=41990 RepID=A0AA38RLP7_9PEZI|nr:Cutinase transcription factor 1 (Acyl-CoA dehydrogenase domain-containing protein) [Pleurostoma richardsiae]
MSTPDSSRRPRAKHACRVCNSRRVRCDVTELHPCSNCRASGATCEVLPSRRGRYHRKPRQQQAAAEESSISASPGTETVTSPPSPSIHAASPGDIDSNRAGQPAGLVMQTRQASSRLMQQRQAATPAPSSTSASAGTVFFGESNFLTLVQGAGAQTGEEDPMAPAGGSSEQRGRLLFPLTGGTPQSQVDDGASPAVSISHLSAGTARYLRDEGALTVPDLKSCLPALQAYFTWFHPCFPVLDRADIARRLPSMDISRLLLQAMLFIGATYCDDATILAMGFRDRSEAKSLLYTRARLLFHADWEKDEITLIQSLFLMSFWRGDKFDVRDVRYWLGVVITFAESSGLHRSTRLTTRNPQMARLRRRIWWSIYVRERQSAASLGLPSRIRDDDCDIELLTATDLESDEEDLGGMSLGRYGPEHVTYAIKMVEMARLLGKVIDLHFVPRRPPSTPEAVYTLDAAVKAWEHSLPANMKDSFEDGTASIWSCLLQVAYNHLRILIHRPAFLHSNDDGAKQIALTAASRISRIAEDMLTYGSLRYGQMHLITSLFAALCIHAISIRRSVGIPRRIAEHKAQMCLLALKDIQKYWRINNRVLDLFLQYLDEAIAKRLHGSQGEAGGQDEAHRAHHPNGSTTTSDQNLGLFTSQSVPESTEQGPTRKTTEAFEDQYFDILSSHWEGDDSLHDLGLFLDPQLQDDPMQVEGLNLLERSL